MKGDDHPLQVDVGVAHGRFQVLHLDHLKYLLAAKAHCRHLVVGITNPDPSLTKFDPANPERSSPERNPLTYYERYRMVRAAFLAQGVPESEVSVVPLPINFPDLYKYYVPVQATFFLTIYDDWGERKLALFQSLGLGVKVLWRRPLSEKGLTATEVRRRIVRRDPWQHLVPPGVAETLSELGVLERLSTLNPA